MIKILFVCLGNICRSPLAEGVFQKYLLENKLTNKYSCDSAGTAGYHIGSIPDKRTIHTAKAHGIRLEHTGQRLKLSDFEEFDFIVAMDKQNLLDIKALQGNSAGRAEVLLFRDFDPEGPGNVPDPYHGTMKDFEEVYAICERTSEPLFQYISTK